MTRASPDARGQPVGETKHVDTTGGTGQSAHDDMVAQPHGTDEEPIAAAEAAAAQMKTDARPHGELGRRFNRQSPFFVGMTAAAGVAVTYGAMHMLITARSVLVLIGVAFFLALGLEPAVSWFVNHQFPRWLATTTVFVIFLALMAAFVAAAIPPLS